MSAIFAEEIRKSNADVLQGLGFQDGIVNRMLIGDLADKADGVKASVRGVEQDAGGLELTVSAQEIDRNPLLGANTAGHGAVGFLAIRNRLVHTLIRSEIRHGIGAGISCHEIQGLDVLLVGGLLINGKAKSRTEHNDGATGGLVLRKARVFGNLHELFVQIRTQLVGYCLQVCLFLLDSIVFTFMELLEDLAVVNAQRRIASQLMKQQGTQNTGAIEGALTAGGHLLIEIRLIAHEITEASLQIVAGEIIGGLVQGLAKQGIELLIGVKQIPVELAVTGRRAAADAVRHEQHVVIHVGQGVLATVEDDLLAINDRFGH